MFEIKSYKTADGRSPFEAWREHLKDLVARIAIDRRLYRIEQNGNFGANLRDYKYCRDGVWELKIDVGQGYRVYYAQEGKTVILLLCGGNKRTQDTDISAAVKYWQDWRERMERKQ